MHKLQEVKNYKRFTIICPWVGFPTKINNSVITVYFLNKTLDAVTKVKIHS